MDNLSYLDDEDYGEDRSSDRGARRRKPDGIDHSDAGIYNELQRLRGLVDVIEGESSQNKRGGIANCLSFSLDNSVMSTVFGLVFVTICTVTIYAFHNLYRAIYKRFFTDPEV